MIKFFRTIRQRMLKENRFSRYFLYAIGEIVLVVIGILIALQINNWSEVQKMQRWEARFLKDLRNELLSDQQQLENVLAVQTAKGSSLKLTMEMLKVAEFSDKPKIDSVYRSSQLDNPTFFPTTGVYDSGLFSGKIDNLHNDSLKYRVMNLYNHYYKRLVYNGEILDDVVGKVDWDKIRYYNEQEGIIRSWEGLVSAEFMALIDYEWEQTHVYSTLALRNHEELEHLIELITNELGE